MIFSLAYSDLPALNAGYVPNLLAPNLFRNPLVPCNDFLPPCTKGCKIDLNFSRENMDEKIKCETIVGYLILATVQPCLRRKRYDYVKVTI